MADLYFSERGPQARTSETISATVWGALRHLIRHRIDDGSFGYRISESCPDGAGPCACDGRKFDVIARAEIPEFAENCLFSDVNGFNLYEILDYEILLNQVRERKVRRAAETDSPFIRARDLFPH
jgi:hypothetical protein